MHRIVRIAATAAVGLALTLPAAGATAAASTANPTAPDTQMASQAQATTAARRCFVTPKARVRAVLIHRTKSVRSARLGQVNRGQHAPAACTASKGGSYTAKGCTKGNWWVKVTWRKRTGWVALGCVVWYSRPAAAASQAPLSANDAVAAGQTATMTTAAAASLRTAAAAARCRGASCSGKNPQVQGCGKDARTIDAVRPGGGGPKLELRRSGKCKAAWARLQKANPSWLFKLQVKNGPTYTGHGSLLYRAYTKMTGSTKPYRACIKGYFGNWACTRWH